MKNYFIFIFFIIFSFPLFASTTWVINKDHSEIHFSLNYLKFAEVSGRFKKFQGRIDFNNSHEPTRLEIHIEAHSIDTGNEIRDGHLRGSEFLATKSSPTITYRSESFTKTKKNYYISEGHITLKNKTHPMMVEFSLSEIIKDTWEFSSQFANFQGKLKRADFNITWNKTLPKEEFLLGDEIKISGVFQIQPQGNSTPSSRHKIPDTSYIREREKLMRGEVAKVQQNYKMTFEPQKSIQVEKPQPHLEPLKSTTGPKSTLWWSALFIMGLIGFLSSIMTSYFFKNHFSVKKGENYSENSLSGILSDGLAIIILMIYSYCFWIIGWS
jgi:polyisoprenoid-binding protein YceI